MPSFLLKENSEHFIMHIALYIAFFYWEITLLDRFVHSFLLKGNELSIDLPA